MSNRKMVGTWIGYQEEYNSPKVKLDVQLYDPGHIYKNEHGKVYTSVTTVLGEFKEKINKEYWSLYKALEISGYQVVPDWSFQTIIVNGVRMDFDLLLQGSVPMNITQADVLKLWKDITDIACNKGSIIHNQIEHGTNATVDYGQGVRDEKTIKNFKNLCTRYSEIHDIIKDYIAAGWKVYTEKVVYIDFLDLAGMIDCLLIKDNQFIILDWKTNKRPLMFKSGYFKKSWCPIKKQKVETDVYVEKEKFMLYPLNTIEDATGMHYTLQLSLYAYMLEYWGFKCVDLKLCHIKGELDENDNFKSEKLTWHRVEYKRKEIENVLIERYKKLHKESNQLVN